MTTDVLTSALIDSMARNLSVSDLVRTAETLKASGQLSSIATLYATWIQHNQDHPLLSAVLFNYSVVLSDAGKLEAARTCLERAIASNPEFMPAYINLGRIYERLGNATLAVVQWSAALAKMAPINGLNVGYKTTALNQSARALEAANQDEAAEEMLRQSLEIDCHQREAIQHLIALRQRQCKWPVISPSERVDHETLMRGISPLSIAALTDDPLLQLALASHYNKLDVGTPEQVIESWPKATGVDGPLRIGYLSSDLREHAVGFLVTEVFGLHDRSAVEVFAYYCGPPANDEKHAHFKSTADHFASVGDLDDISLARKMVDDGIQILVDLNGYTREARLKAVALRPAPVIVNWLGYPGSMGSPYHHYLIADDYIIPPSHEIYYSEKVVRLPCYQPSARQRQVMGTPSRADVGLPEQAMVYCCFNGAHKINRFTFDRWLMILSRVPESVLWLLGSTENANERLRDYAEQHGIARERVICAAKLANPYHLARYPLADLFLDTTPYGAHTTASDALWMGVPVLTLSGRSFASRVCGSLVKSSGIGDEFICSSPEQFVERAVAFGTDRRRLLPARERLRSARETSALFDMPGLVRRLEGLYRQMWVDHQNNQLPRANLANLDVLLELGCPIKHDDIEVQSIRDYHAWWLDRIARRNRVRPIEADRRIVTLAQKAPNVVADSTATAGS